MIDSPSPRPTRINEAREFGRDFFADPEKRPLRRVLLFLGCTLLAVVLTLWLGRGPELQAAGQRALFILLLSVLLWVTEAIPAFSVGILLIALQIALLGDPSTGVFARTDRDWEQFVAVLGHPLIWLFFGGFVLAAGMARCDLDRWLAARLLARFGEQPGNVLLGVMLATFTLSMFMSNTATTAVMLAILAPLLAGSDTDSRMATGLLIGTAVSANLGGMGSLIGTPPNAIAVGALAEMTPRQSISFLQWLMLGLPPALVSLLVAWRALLWLYPAQHGSTLRLAVGPSGQPGEATGRAWQRGIVAAALLITVLMWLTSQWHGIPTAAVSFLPIVLLTTTGILGVPEIRGLSYDVLFLMAGGLALGQMVAETGLSEWIVGRLPLQGISQTSLVMLLAYTTVLLSNFMSNTAAANVMIPLGVTLASGFESSVAVAIAFGASAAMALPVATPPNAMVFATGRCKASDFIKIGLLLGLLVPAVGLFWLRWVLPVVLGLGW